MFTLVHLRLKIAIRIKDTFLQKCVSSCSITQYVKTYEWIGNWKSVQSEAATYDFSFYHALAKNETKVFEEYLIHDLMSMIGSVGGTLGLFIGFPSTILLVMLYTK